MSSNETKSNFIVNVHTLPLINISDYYTRNTLSGNKNFSGGVLFGSVKDNFLDVSHSWEFKFKGNDLDEEFISKRVEQYETIFPSLKAIGWFILSTSEYNLNDDYEKNYILKIQNTLKKLLKNVQFLFIIEMYKLKENFEKIINNENSNLIYKKIIQGLLPVKVFEISYLDNNFISNPKFIPCFNINYISTEAETISVEYLLEKDNESIKVELSLAKDRIKENKKINFFKNNETKMEKEKKKNDKSEDITIDDETTNKKNKQVNSIKLLPGGKRVFLHPEESNSSNENNIKNIPLTKKDIEKKTNEAKIKYGEEEIKEKYLNFLSSNSSNFKMLNARLGLIQTYLNDVKSGKLTPNYKILSEIQSIYRKWELCIMEKNQSDAFTKREVDALALSLLSEALSTVNFNLGYASKNKS